MEVRGFFSVTNEDLLTYLPSNWSEWSRWFLDQSQLYYGELAVILRKQEWPTSSRDDEMRILDALQALSAHPSVPPPPSSTQSGASAAPGLSSDAQTAILSESDRESEHDPSQYPDSYPWSQTGTLASWYDSQLPQRATVLEHLLIHVHKIGLDEKRAMRRRLPAFWQLIMSTLSDGSRKMVMADRHYETFMAIHDVLGLWQLIKHIHTRDKGGTLPTQSQETGKSRNRVHNPHGWK
jgi:hypothetical protein